MLWNHDDSNDDNNNGSSRPPQGPWNTGSNPSGKGGGGNDSSSKGESPNPWARRGGSTGPSGGNNIDDLIDNVQDRIRKIISGGGRGPSNNNGGFGRNTPKGSWAIVSALVVGGVALWMSTGLYRVQEGELGVVLRFGEMVRISSPGLQYHLPAPFESVIVQKVAALNIIDGGLKADKGGDAEDASLILTADSNMVHTNYTVQWKIKDVSEYLFTTRNPEATIRAAAASVVREVIGQTSARLALTEGRGQIEIQAQELLQKLLDQYKMGIQIVSIQLQNVSPPHQVVDKFNDLQASLVNADQSRNEAESYRNDIIPRAEGEAAEIVNKAEADRQRMIAEAEGEANRFTQVLVAYEANPAIIQKRYYLKTMREVLSKIPTKFIVDEKVGKGIQSYLPLNELKANELKAHSMDSTEMKKASK